MFHVSHLFLLRQQCQHVLHVNKRTLNQPAEKHYAYYYNTGSTARSSCRRVELTIFLSFYYYCNSVCFVVCVVIYVLLTCSRYQTSSEECTAG